MQFSNYINIPNSEVQIQNGRVINVNENPTPWFKSFDKNEPNNAFQTQALFGIQSETPLNKLFLSKENVKNLQDMIRYNVYIKSGDKKYIIGNQSTIELEIIMRSIFLQHSQNLPFKIKEQIKELNNLIIADAVPRIIAQIEQYNGYLWEVEHNPVPIELPKNMSSSGTRLLRSVTTTF